MKENKSVLINEADLERWALLYRIAGYSAIGMILIIPIQIVVYMVYPVPESIESWFELFHNNWFIGLLHMDFLYIINILLLGVLYLAFYFSLRERNKTLITVALFFGFVSIAAYLSSNTCFEMLFLSSHYYSATSEAVKASYLAAGQGMIVTWVGTAFNVYYVLNAVVLIIVASVMLQSPVYGKKIAITGLISGLLMLIPSTAGNIGLIFSMASLIPWLIFAIMIAIKFLHLSKL
ncbi:MAG: DUF4386 family protein [Atribacterota bacterium]|jgi:hypothetical protein|nr:DUF4386 family protein [Atribacterota bacterium]MDD5637920.1 DUF4386 family protein [Atribacterota bacterium]